MAGTRRQQETAGAEPGVLGPTWIRPGGGVDVALHELENHGCSRSELLPLIHALRSLGIVSPIAIETSAELKRKARRMRRFSSAASGRAVVGSSGVTPKAVEQCELLAKAFSRSELRRAENWFKAHIAAVVRSQSKSKQFHHELVASLIDAIEPRAGEDRLKNTQLKWRKRHQSITQTEAMAALTALGSSGSTVADTRPLFLRTVALLNPVQKNRL
jgi:hypothetical protein